jgi:Ca2+-transporting ATPase
VKDLYIGEGDSSAEPVSAQEAWDLIVTGCTLCHDRAYIQTMALANPLDRALISFAENQGTNIEELAKGYERIYQKPFNSEERYMACGYNDGSSGKRIYFAKGDPEVLLKKYNSYVSPLGERRSKDFSFLSEVRAKVEEMRHDGSVIIALAYSENSFAKSPSSYTFLCLFRLENPLRPDAKAVLRELSEKGMRNMIFTGDRTETAIRVATETGTENAATFFLIGREIERMSLPEVTKQCEYVSVFARLSPSQKGIVTRGLQKRGHGVAVIGESPD